MVLITFKHYLQTVVVKVFQNGDAAVHYGYNDRQATLLSRRLFGCNLREEPRFASSRFSCFDFCSFLGFDQSFNRRKDKYLTITGEANRGHQCVMVVQNSATY